MAESDSDGCDADCLSPLASSVNAVAGGHTSVSRYGWVDTPALNRMADDQQHVDEDERVPLLSNSGDRLRRYHSTPAFRDTQRASKLAVPPPQRGLRRKISRVLQPKAYDYDADKHSLAAVGSGERVW
jgi:hypothetical protein